MWITFLLFFYYTRKKERRRKAKHIHSFDSFTISWGYFIRWTHERELFCWLFVVFEAKQERRTTFLSIVLVVIIIHITGWLITMETRVKGKRQLWKNRIIPSYKLHPQPSRHYDAILRLKGPAGWLLPNIFFSSFFVPWKEARIIREKDPLSVKNTIKLPSDRRWTDKSPLVGCRTQDAENTKEKHCHAWKG